MDDRIIGALGIATVVVVALALMSHISSTYELDQAYEQYINTSTVRNEWGQLPADFESMCTTTIRQWSELCK